MTFYLLSFIVTFCLCVLAGVDLGCGVGFPVVVVCGLLTVAARLVAERVLWAHGLQWLQCVGSSTGSVVRGTWVSCSTSCGNLPGPGMEPVSPALAGGFFTTEPPGTPFIYF